MHGNHSKPSCLEHSAALLMCLYAAMALISLKGVWESVKASLLSVMAAIAGCILVPVVVVEFATRRIAEHPKGPIIALTLIATAAVSFLKALS